MREFITILSTGQKDIVEIITIICEIIGVVVLLSAVFKSLIKYFFHDARTKIMLARGIALALEFKLAGEVLRTVTMRTLDELMILGAIVILRAAISVLIHWEVKADRYMDDREK